MVQMLEHRGYLALHGAYFSVMDGRLLALDEESGRVFAQVAPKAHAAALRRPAFDAARWRSLAPRCSHDLRPA